MTVAVQNLPAATFLSRMYAVQATPAHLSASSSTAPAYDANASTMSRVPIAALLRPDTAPSAVTTERFQLHGRSYYKLQNDMYNLPCDDVEFERLDIMHHLIYLVALNKQLHQATLRPSNSLRVLDVGFGTGFWMLDMEKKYPGAEIIGIDMDDSIGSGGDSRCLFKAPVDFTAPQWPIEDSSVDLVHMSQLCGSVPDWLAHYKKAYRCLRPGTGQIEHVEVDWAPRTSEAQFPQAAIDVYNWWWWVCEASRIAGRPMNYPDDTEELMESAGFVDVSHKRVKIPMYTDGRKDKREWALAHGYQTAMGHIDTQSFTGLSMALLTRYLQFAPEQVQMICEKVVAVIGQRDLPLYINLHVWTARRPQG